MPVTKKLETDHLRTPAEQALAAALVTENDLLRLKAIARLHARGLPPEVSWCDLLQEAIARVLDGSRRQPEGVSTVAFLAGVMRSLRAEHWRRALRQAAQMPMMLVDLDSVDAPAGEARDPAPTPERYVLAAQELARIERLFADDVQAQQLIAGLADQLSPEEICANCGMTKTDYDSTRRRIRRALLREGLRVKEP
jgi:DNA-directed RNA polymerase specialized sigma24 family protein